MRVMDIQQPMFVLELKIPEQHGLIRLTQREKHSFRILLNLKKLIRLGAEKTYKLTGWVAGLAKYLPHIQEQFPREESTSDQSIYLYMDFRSSGHIESVACCANNTNSQSQFRW